MAFRSSSNNNTLKHGHSTEYAQGEVTLVTVFDYKNVSLRKDAANRNNVMKQLMYPNVTDPHLGIEENEFVVAMKYPNNQTRSGGQKLSVFSSLNGFDLAPYHGRMCHAMRNLQWVGIAKTVYRLDGTPSTGPSGPSYAMESGIAVRSSGSGSANRHTGHLPIPAGALVCLYMPELPGLSGSTLSVSGRTYISPNNPGHGQPLGKYLMVTAPFNPSDFSFHLQTAHALFRVPVNANPVPGIMGLKIEDLSKNLPGLSANRVNTDGQEESARLWLAMFGNFFTILEQLKNIAVGNVNVAGNPAVAAALQNVMGAPTEGEIHTSCVNLMKAIGVHGDNAASREPALACADAVMLNNCVAQSRQQVVVETFKRRNPTAFHSGTFSALTSTNTPTLDQERYAVMCWDAIGNLFGAYASAAFEKGRWVVGRARNSCLPGGTLDLNLSNNARPISK